MFRISGWFLLATRMPVRFEPFLGIAMLVLIPAGWCIRCFSRRETLMQVLFMVAAVFYLAVGSTDKRSRLPSGSE